MEFPSSTLTQSWFPIHLVSTDHPDAEPACAPGLGGDGSGQPGPRERGHESPLFQSGVNACCHGSGEGQLRAHTEQGIPAAGKARSLGWRASED